MTNHLKHQNLLRDGASDTARGRTDYPSSSSGRICPSTEAGLADCVTDDALYFRFVAELQRSEPIKPETANLVPITNTKEK